MLSGTPLRPSSWTPATRRRSQNNTESVKLAKKFLLVISLPASDTSGSPHAVADDVEVGGERGRAARDRLRSNCSSECHQIAIAPIVPRPRRCASERP